MADVKYSDFTLKSPPVSGDFVVGLDTAASVDDQNVRIPVIDFALLSITNTYTAGKRQDFVGLLAGTAPINIGGIAGNPTTQANGDIWINTSTNQIFARVNGADLDLGVSGFDTAGTGLTSSGSTVNVIGTTNRIVANANDIDISASYVGQASITTLGTITTGVWNGTAILGANINAQLSDLSDVTAKTGTGTIVVMDTSPTIVTPTITSFINATHDHTNAAGGGTLLSTTALSDTANIAYLNTANTYIAGNKQSFVADATTAALNLNAQLPSGLAAGDIYRTAEIFHFIGTSLTDYILVNNGQPTTYTAGVRQDFLGLLAGTAGLNVGGIAGNPTSQVDGDLWLNTSTNQVFARINGANVDLGAGAAGGDMVLADVQTVTGAKTFGTIGGAVDKFILAGSTSGSTILNAAAIAGTTTITLPGTSGTVVITGLASQIALGTEVTGASTALSDTADLAYLNQANTFGAFLNSFVSSTMRIPLSATPIMAVDGDFAIDTTVTDFSHGILKYFDGEELGVVSMPIAQFTTPADGAVPTYSAANDEFELIAGGGGGTDGWTFIGSSTSATPSVSSTDFDELMVLVYAHSKVGTSSNPGLQFNGDTAFVYDNSSQTNGAGSSVGLNSGVVFNGGSTLAADFTASATVFISNSVAADTSGNYSYTRQSQNSTVGGFTWNNAAKVTSIVLFDRDSNGFQADSHIIVFGRDL